MKLHWDVLDMESNLQPLKQCNQKKIAIAEQFYALYQLFSQNHQTTLADTAKNRCISVLEDRFVCFITGENSKDTDSVLNALLGQEIYNADTAPRIDIPIHMQYGTKKKVIFSKTTSMFPQEKAVEDLPSIITQKHNPNNTLQIESIQIELPIPMLRNGVIFTYVPSISNLTSHISQHIADSGSCADIILLVHANATALTQAEMTLIKNMPKNMVLLIVIPQPTYTTAENTEAPITSMGTDIQKSVFDTSAPLPLNLEGWGFFFSP